MKQNEDIRRIHTLIDDYFDAATSIAEERELRSLLVTTKIITPKIDEARAVMGLMAVERIKRRHKSVISWQSIVGIAASVAVIVAVGLGIYGKQENVSVYDDRCIAFTGASEISDAEGVMVLFDSQLRMIDEAATSLETDIAGQLSVLAEISTL